MFLVFFSRSVLFFLVSFFLYTSTPIYKFFFYFLFSRSPIKRKHRNVSVNVETHQQSIEREARKLKKNIIFAFVNRPHSRSMCFLCWTKIIINGISGVLIEACTGWPEFSRGGKQNNKKKKERERERERGKEKSKNRGKRGRKGLEKRKKYIWKFRVLICAGEKYKISVYRLAKARNTPYAFPLVMNPLTAVILSKSDTRKTVSLSPYRYLRLCEPLIENIFHRAATM